MARIATAARFLDLPASKVISFNGSSDLATLPIAPTASGWSLAFWVRLPDFDSNFGRLLDYMDGSSNGLRIVLNTPTNRFLTCDAKTTGAGGVNGLTGSMKRGEFQHVVFSNVSGSCTLYINSVLNNTGSGTYTAPTAQTFTIGRQSNAAALFGKFLLKDFVFKNGTPFTQTEINALYASGVIPTGATCAISFNNSATDLTGNGNDATLTGTSYVTTVPPFATARSLSATRTLTSARTAV